MLAFCGEVTLELDYAACWQGFMTIRSVVVVVVSLIYIFLTLTFAISVFEQDPTAKNEILSRPHSRVEVCNVIMKTILAICFVLLEQDSRYAERKNIVFLILDIIGFWWRFALLEVSQCVCCMSLSCRFTIGRSTYCAFQ